MNKLLKVYRKRINPPYAKRDIPIVLLTLICILAIAFIMLGFSQKNIDKGKAATIADPSGETMPIGDLPGWHQIFAENFSQDAAVGQFKTVYADKFTNYGDGWMGTGNISSVRRCTPKVVSVAGGVMTYTLHQETLPSTDPCSGGTAGTYWLNAVEQPAINGQTIKQLYGKYTIRFRVNGTLLGQYMVPLLWPVSEIWPHDGEIDFPEGHLEGNICAFLHHQDATTGSDQEAFCPGVSFSPGWHTASTEWSPGNATFILDGTVIGHSTTRVPNTTMRYVLQSETCIGGTANCPAAGSSATIDFDWVVAYATGPAQVISDTPATTSTPATATPTPLSTTDKTPPTIAITYPTNDTTISRKSSITITAIASDASGINKVEFFVNGSIRCSDTIAAYTCTFVSGAAKGAQYTLTAKAYDRANNIASSSVIVTGE